MLPEDQVTVRNAGLLLLQRASQVLNALLFAALVPRWMGPTTYGQFSLLNSIALWLVFSSGLGFFQILGRHIPVFLHQNNREGLGKLVGQLATTRLALGATGSTLYFALTVLFLTDLDRSVLALMTGVVFFHLLANFIFMLFLGLNQAARWGMGETLRRMLSLAFLLAGLAAGGLTGACLGLALAEFAVLSIGCLWARPLLHRRHFGLSPSFLAPYLRMGLIFFAGDIIMATFQFGGATLIWLVLKDYAQVSYFGLAYQGYVLLAVAINQLSMAFTPLLGTLYARRDTQGLKQWVEQLLKWAALSAVFLVFGVLLLADTLVPLVLGSEFRQVTNNFMLMTLALLTHGLASMGGVLAMIGDRPDLTLGAAALRLTAFLTLGALLVGRWGSLGGSLAVLLAAMLHAGYLGVRLRGVFQYSLRTWGLTLALGGLFAPLVWLKSSFTLNLGLFGLFLGGYAGLLFFLGLVTPRELTAAWRALASRGAPPAQAMGKNGN